MPSSRIAVAAVLIASVVLLAFDTFYVLSNYMNERRRSQGRDKRESFEQSVRTDLGLELMEPVNLAFLRVFGRYPSLSEQTTYVNFLVSEKSLNGGNVRDPQELIVDLLRNTNEYREIEVMSSSRSSSVGVSRISDVPSYGEEIVQRDRKHTNMVMDVYTRGLSRLPTVLELEEHVGYTREEVVEKVLAKKEKDHSFGRDVHGNDSSFDEPDAEAEASVSSPVFVPSAKHLEAHARIEDAYKKVYGTLPPIYLTELLMSTYEDLGRDEGRMVAHLRRLMDNTREGGDLETCESADRSRRNTPVAYTKNGFSTTTIPHADVGESVDLSGMIASNSQVMRRSEPKSKRMDSLGKMVLDRNMFVASIEDSIPTC